MDVTWVDELAKLRRAPGVATDGREISDGWVEAVLAFWFEELEPADWFKKSCQTDRAIGERFLVIYHALSQAPVADLSGSPETMLAAIIVLDQFPRNMFRGHPQSFASDDKALALADKAISAGFDQDVRAARRVFLYIPFEHSENLVDQERAVRLISSLGDAEYTKYAVAHRDVIEQFGRFPHRNEILGRPSTPDELTYLAQPGSGF